MADRVLHPPGSTHVIHIPKDHQVYHPENDHHSKRRNRCRFCCCCCCFLGVLILLVGISAAVFYLVYRLESPHYSIHSISIKNFNASSSSSSSSVNVRADNPNSKIGIYYLTGSSVSVFHKGAKLSTGALPVFLQGKNNVTVFTVKGTAGVDQTRGLVGEAKRGAVALRVVMKIPMKFKVGSVKSWKINLTVSCQVTVVNAKIVSEKCDNSFDFLLPLRSFKKIYSYTGDN